MSRYQSSGIPDSSFPIPNYAARLRALEFQPYVDEVIRRPRAGVLEGEALEPSGDGFDLRVESGFLIARDEERGVHDHLVADRLVDSRRHRHLAQLIQDLGHVAL